MRYSRVRGPGPLAALGVCAALAATPVSGQDVEALYQEACDDGEYVVCNVLGLMYETGYRGIGRDEEQAARLYTRACTGGELGGCTNLGLMYEEGRAFPENPERAAELYAEACDAEEPLACDYLGGLYQRGAGVRRDYQRAVQLFERACDADLLIGCVHLGAMALSGVGMAPDPVRALALYVAACGGGEMRGCLNLGVSYERGEGTSPDPTRAVPYYEQACDGGELLGCANLGSLYRRGSGVTQDLARAARLYERACNGGITVGCANLGGMYQTGEGVEQDDARAIELYARACAGGAAPACAQVGLEPPSTATVDVPAGPTGTVADSQTGVGLEDAVLALPELGVLAVSDGEGRVELPPLDPGRYAIKAERVGYDVTEGELEVPTSTDFVVLLNQLTVDNPDNPGTLLGRVVDGESGQGLSNVEIIASGTSRIVAVSNGQGRFSLIDVEPGLVQLRFRRLGYATRDWTMVVQAGRTVEISAEMATEAIDLEPITVVAERSQFLEQAGFYDREMQGAYGSQFDRQALEALDPFVISDVIWRVPGVMVVRGNEGAQVYSTRNQGFGGTGCAMTNYLDGVRVGSFDLDAIAPEQIEAIEVYQGLGVPIQYQTPDRCGVVLLWTRRGR